MRILVLLAAVLALSVLAAVVWGDTGPIVLIGGPISIVLLLWAVRQTLIDPFWLIFALVLEETLPYINLLPFDPESRWWLRYPLLWTLCLPAAILAWKSGTLKRGYLVAYLGFCGWAAISVVYSKYPGISAGRLLPVVLLVCALSFAAAKVRTGADLQVLLDKFLIACGILIVLNIGAAILFPNNIAVEGEELPIGVYTWIADQAGILRFCGFFGQPNDIGGLMLATVGAGLLHWRVVHGWRRPALIAAMASSVVMAAMADSRSPFVALAVGLVAFAIWKYRLRGFVVCGLCGVLLIALYGAMGRGEKTYVNRDIDTFTGRTTLWKFEVTKIAQNPLLGYGYDIEGGLYEDRYFPDWNKVFADGPNTSLQNGYLSVAVGVGVPAMLLWLLAFLAPWISVFIGKTDHWRLKPIFFLVVVPALVLALSESGIAEPRYPEGLLVFLAWIVAERYRLLRREAEAAERYAFDAAATVNRHRLVAQ